VDSPPKKTRAKRTPEKTRRVVKEKPRERKRVVYESSESEEAPDTSVDTHRLAAEVLQLLSAQRANQKAMRRDRYAHFVQNL